MRSHWTKAVPRSIKQKKNNASIAKPDDLTKFWPPCRILTEERHRYCNLVASLKPIIDEELGMLSELASVEDVMQKLGNVTTNPDEVSHSIYICI